MTNTSTYLKYYHILETQAGCDWESCRKAYRHQAQKWHPDRFAIGSQQHELAQIKIREINEAYQALFGYYKKYGILPQCLMNDPTLQSQDTVIVTTPTPEGTQHQPSTDQASTHGQSTSYSQHAFYSFQNSSAMPNQTPIMRKLKWAFALGLVASVAFIMVIYLGNQQLQASILESAKNKQMDRAAPMVTQPTSSATLVEQPKAKKPTNPVKLIKIGSEKSEVLNIQGRPLSQTKTMWTYGSSTVYFRDDKVVSWYSSPNDPLLVDVQLK